MTARSETIWVIGFVAFSVAVVAFLLKATMEQEVDDKAGRDAGALKRAAK